MRKSFFLLSMVIHCLLFMFMMSVKTEIPQQNTPEIRNVELQSPEKIFAPAVKAAPQISVPKTKMRRVVVKPFKIESPEGGGDKRALKGGEGRADQIPAVKEQAEPVQIEDSRAEEIAEEVEKRIKENNNNLLFNNDIAREVIKKDFKRKKPQSQSHSSGDDEVQFSGNKGFFSKTGDGVVAHGGAAFLNLDGYDITPWARRTVYRIKKNWFTPEAVKLGVRGSVTIFAAIEPDGRLSALRIRKSSGVDAYDRAAVAALTGSVPFMALPHDFPNPNLQVLFIFQYH